MNSNCAVRNLYSDSFVINKKVLPISCVKTKGKRNDVGRYFSNNPCL